jgi:cbb3-type cytochrome oxidase cytochrome c subunit
MSKTNEMYLDKARTLTKGLREHLETVKNYGVSESDLSKLESAILEGEKLNVEVDRRRAELNEIVPTANHKMAEIRNLTAYLKNLVKRRVDSSHWPEYGISDKR